jgi:hypothetical protein
LPSTQLYLITSFTLQFFHRTELVDTWDTWHVVLPQILKQPG